MADKQIVEALRAGAGPVATPPGQGAIEVGGVAEVGLDDFRAGALDDGVVDADVEGIEDAIPGAAQVADGGGLAAARLGTFEPFTAEVFAVIPIEGDGEAVGQEGALE